MLICLLYLNLTNPLGELLVKLRSNWISINVGVETEKLVQVYTSSIQEIYSLRTVLWFKNYPPDNFEARFSQNRSEILKNIRNKSSLEFHLV